MIPLPFLSLKKIAVAAAGVILLSPLFAVSGADCGRAAPGPALRGAFCAVEHVAPFSAAELDSRDAVLPAPLKVMLALVLVAAGLAAVFPRVMADQAARFRRLFIEPALPRRWPFKREGYLPYLCAMRDP